MINLQLLQGKTRSLILVLLIILLGPLLLLYPLDWGLQSGPLQSMQVTYQPALFGIALTLFLGSVVTSVFLTKSERIRVTLLVIYGIYFLGFWAMRSPNGVATDEFANMGIVNYILAGNALTVRQYSTLYLDYPVMHLLGANLSLVLGMPIILLRQALTVFFVGMFTFGLFVFIRSVLHDKDQQIVAYLLAVTGSLIWAHFQAFVPGGFAYLIFFPLLIAIVRRLRIFLLLSLGLIMAYFPASFLIILLLGGIWVVERVGSVQSRRSGLEQIAIFALFMFAWNVYWAFTSYSSILRYLSVVFVPGAQLSWVSTVYSTISNVPFWVNLIQYLWFGLVTGMGSLFALFFLGKRKRMTSQGGLLLAGIGACWAFGLISFFFAPGGSQFSRLLYYVPIFASPLVAGTLVTNRRRTVTCIVIFFLVATLAYPTFVVQSRSITASAIYGFETSLGQYVGSFSSSPNSVTTDTLTSGILQFYLPNSQFYTASYNPAVMEQAFGDPNPGLVILTSKTEAVASFSFGTSVANATLSRINISLASLDRVYDSTLAEVYFR